MHYEFLNFDSLNFQFQFRYHLKVMYFMKSKISQVYMAVQGSFLVYNHASKQKF